LDSPVYHLDKVIQSKTDELEDFDGPLDLILHLLSKNKMAIKDIQIALILDQYMEWMEARKELDLEVASEFVTMAAHLVYIKTKMLLTINEEEVTSELDELIASLEAHQRNETYLRIKSVIPQFDQMYNVGKDYLVKPPEVFRGTKVYKYKHQTMDIYNAMHAVLNRIDSKLPPPVSAFQGIVGHEPYPVTSKAEEIVQRLIRFGITRFKALFKGNRSRSEIVATFLAVLELCRANRLKLAGNETDCTISYTDQDDNATDSFDKDYEG